MPTVTLSTIFVLNGPNLNLLGTREPILYGTETLSEIRSRCERRAAKYSMGVDFRQSNFEGALIESCHEAREKAAGIVINPASLSFTSVSLVEALKAFEGPIIEVHLSNIHKRNAPHNASLISPVTAGVIAGIGALGYEFAIDAINLRLREDEK
jgi:3-dehydroquinate dehydratase-2